MKKILIMFVALMASAPLVAAKYHSYADVEKYCFDTSRCDDGDVRACKTQKIGKYTWSYIIVESEGDEIAVIFKVVSTDSGKILPVAAVSPKPKGTIAIPDTLGGKPVVVIGSDAFKDCNELKSVKIPASVEYIYGFDECCSLTSFEVAKENPRYSSINGLLLYDEYRKCHEANIKDLAKRAKSDEEAKYELENRKDTECDFECILVQVPRGATHIDIPKHVTDIQWNFNECKNLKSITINGSSTGSIKPLACSGATRRREDPPLYDDQRGYLLSDGLLLSNYMDSSVIMACVAKGNVRIPKDVDSITAEPFRWCSGIKSFSVDRGNTACTAVNGLLLTKDGKAIIRGINGKVKIPDSVTSIWGYVISKDYIARMAEVLGSTVDNVTFNLERSIDTWAFDGCDVSSFSVGPKNLWFSSSDGHLLSKDGKRFIKGCNGMSKVHVPSGVEVIESNAFSDCSKVQTIVMPESVREIKGPFAACDKLKSVVFEGSSAVHTDDAFEGFGGKCKIYVPKGAEGWGTVPGTWHGSKIEYLNEAAPNAEMSEKVGMYTWSYRVAGNGVSEITAVTPKPKGGIEIPSKLGGKSVTAIGSRAFVGCKGMQSVKIPDTVKNVTPGVFKDCSKLAVIKVDKGNSTYSVVNGLLIEFLVREEIVEALLSVEEERKTMRNKLSDMDKELDGVDKKPDNEGIAQLKAQRESLKDQIQLLTRQKEDLEDELKGLFRGEKRYRLNAVPPALSSVDIPDIVTSIGDMAFSGCAKIEKLTIPKGISRIWKDAFVGCDHLTAITVDGDNSKYSSADGQLTSKDGKTILWSRKSQLYKNGKNAKGEKSSGTPKKK